MSYHNWMTGIYDEADGIFFYYEKSDEINWLRDIIKSKIGKDALWDEDGLYKFTPKEVYEGFPRPKSNYELPKVPLKIMLLRHYGIRECMIEQGSLTLETFYEEVLQIVYEYVGLDTYKMVQLQPYISKMNGWANFFNNVIMMVKSENYDPKFESRFTQMGLGEFWDKENNKLLRGADLLSHLNGN